MFHSGPNQWKKNLKHLCILPWDFLLGYYLKLGSLMEAYRCISCRMRSDWVTDACSPVEPKSLRSAARLATSDSGSRESGSFFDFRRSSSIFRERLCKGEKHPIAHKFNRMNHTTRILTSRLTMMEEEAPSAQCLQITKKYLNIICILPNVAKWDFLNDFQTLCMWWVACSSGGKS